MVLGFAVLVAGGLLLEAGISGRSLADVVRGLATVNHRLKFNLPGDLAPLTANSPAQTGNDFLDSVLGSTAGGKGKSPKGVIDTIVIPIARKHGVPQSPATVAAKNAVHGPTTTGNRSDHQGPPETAWADDMGIRSKAQGDALAAELAKVFGFPQNTGLQTKRWGDFIVQLIWQAPDHYDHVHLGLHKA